MAEKPLSIVLTVTAVALALGLAFVGNFTFAAEDDPTVDAQSGTVDKDGQTSGEEAKLPADITYEGPMDALIRIHSMSLEPEGNWKFREFTDDEKTGGALDISGSGKDYVDIENGNPTPQSPAAFVNSSHTGLSVNAAFMDDQVDAGDYPLRMEGNLKGGGGEGGPADERHWAAKIQYLEVDLDIDSDNSGLFDAAERSTEEDDIEDRDKDPDTGKALLGKLLYPNIDNTDSDNVVDYLDDQILGDKFVPLTLEISNAIDLTTATIKFQYPGVAPGQGGAGIRIWKKDASENRDRTAVSQDGDFIPADTELDPDDLGITDDSRVKSFYIEGVKPMSAGTRKEISVSVTFTDYSGQSQSNQDTVNVTQPTDAVFVDWMNYSPAPFAQAWSDNAVALLATSHARDVLGFDMSDVEDEVWRELKNHFEIRRLNRIGLPFPVFIVDRRANGYSSDDDTPAPGKPWVLAFLFRPYNNVSEVAARLKKNPQDHIYLSGHGYTWGGTHTFDVPSGDANWISLEHIMQLYDLVNHPNQIAPNDKQAWTPDHQALKDIANNVNKRLTLWACNIARGLRGKMYLKLWENLYGHQGLRIEGVDDFIFHPLIFDGYWGGHLRLPKRRTAGDPALPMNMYPTAFYNQDGDETTSYHFRAYRRLFVNPQNNAPNNLNNLLNNLGQNKLIDDFQWLP